MRQKFTCGKHGIDLKVDDCPQCKIDLMEKEMASLRERLEELEIWKKAYDDISTSYAVKTNDLGIALRRAGDELHNMESVIQNICASKAKAKKAKPKK